MKRFECDYKEELVEKVVVLKKKWLIGMRMNLLSGTTQRVVVARGNLCT